MGTEALNCKCCGGVLKASSSICECEYCGAVNIVTGESGKYINQLNRANKFRQDNDFDRALKIYDDILAENCPTVDVLWSRVLCEYGIEYVPDPSSNKYIPTLHRIKDESILNNSSYLEALEIADESQKATIKNEAMVISRIQNEYLDIVSKEKPYDVFICYKETDDVTKQQTEDSGLALDLYERLVNYGFKVFFARVTLQDKIGVNYEPYIFGALKSSKIMIVMGTKPEYFTSVWVKNEWSRFLKLKEIDKDKQMFFACDSVDDLPKAFSGRQAQLLNQPNAIQNLAFIVKRCLEQLRYDNPNTELKNIPNQNNIVKEKVFSIDDYIQLISSFIKTNDCNAAEKVLLKAFEIDPNNSILHGFRVIILTNKMLNNYTFDYNTNKKVSDEYILKKNEEKWDYRNLDNYISSYFEIIGSINESEVGFLYWEPFRLFNSFLNQGDYLHKEINSRLGTHNIKGLTSCQEAAEKCKQINLRIYKLVTSGKIPLPVIDKELEFLINRENKIRYSNAGSFCIQEIKEPASIGEEIWNKLKEAGWKPKLANSVIMYYKTTYPNYNSRALTEFIKMSSKISKKGCYVATCVYGSYDCPEVWTLRRFRDYTLDKTWYGRAFIKTYYTISPIAVAKFGNYSWFRNMFKKSLDNMVKRLSLKGYENTPYDDKY